MMLFFLLSIIFLQSVSGEHPCDRECVSGAPPMTCFFDFKIESYQTLSKACYRCAEGERDDCLLPHCVTSDGIARPITVVNRQMPGPSIHVCLGDRVVVNVENSLASDTTSLHWHGHHQRGSPHMDGVPHVTQCPVLPGTSFRYVFFADNPGTHFWHSHSGLQRAEGVYGALIIRQGKNDPHRNAYDVDLTENEVHITDWLHGPASSKFIGHHHGDGNNKPRSILINGRGRYGNTTFMSNISVPAVPLTNFTLIPGMRHRFRLINSGFLNCPMELSIDNHTLVVIASDGSDLQPIEVDSLVSYAGERFDFVVNASMLTGRYWMRVRGLMDCDERFNSVHQVAVVEYKGTEDEEFPSETLGYFEAMRGGKQLNPLNIGANDDDPNTITMAEVSSLKRGDPSLLNIKPDHVFYIGYDFYKKDNPVFHPTGLYGFHQVSKNTERILTPQLNHISLHLPATPMIMQNEASLAPLLCNQSSLARQGRNCKSEFCRCLHRIRVELGDIVDLILLDEGVAFNANHPFHLHGHAFHIIGMHQLGSNTSVSDVKDFVEQLPINASSFAPVKDTVTVPDGGFTRLRFRASNPGVWLFHCHIGFHVEIGMGFVLQVGDWSSFVAPPKGFPTCGDWMPDVDSIYTSQEENQLVLLTPGEKNEHLLYQLLSNISQKLNQPSGSPPFVVVQHTWPSDWWPSKFFSNSAGRSSSCQVSTLIVAILTILACRCRLFF